MSIEISASSLYLKVPLPEDRLEVTLASLDAEIKVANERIERTPPHEFLHGEWGLDGICVGFSLECVDHVNHHGEAYPIPQLMMKRPPESMRHLSKMLVLATYKSIGKEVDPEALVRSPQNKETLLKIVKNYEQLVLDQTGIQMMEITPGPSFYETASMKDLADDFSQMGGDHYIYVMSNSQDTLLNWHMIYVNPKLGIIGDAGFLWKINPADKEFFPQAFAHFVKEMEYDQNLAVRVRLGKTAEPSSCPLLINRIFRRAQTMMLIAEHSGVVMASMYLWTIHKHNPLLNLIREPDLSHTCKELDKFVTQNTMQELFDFIESNLDEVGQIKDFEPVQRLTNSAFYISEFIHDPEKSESVLTILKKIKDLGPKADLFLSILIGRILMQVPQSFHLESRYPIYEEHVLQTFVPALLKLRSQSKNKCDLDDLMRYPSMEDIQIPFWDLLMKAGASPNSSAIAQKYNQTPLYRARDRNMPTIEAFFIKAGATI